MSHDDGTSLTELMVGMVLMSIFLVMFTGAILMMKNAMNNSVAVNLTSSQLNSAFLKLDNIREISGQGPSDAPLAIRYATAISTPSNEGGGGWHVEYLTTTSGKQVCAQLWVDTVSQQLKRRSWPVAPPTKVTDWLPISSGISNGDGAAGARTQPFYLVPPGPNTVFQQLTINLIPSSEPSDSQTTSTSSYTFTALNSSALAPPTQNCQRQVGP
jgi:hypothetical protein